MSQPSSSPIARLRRWLKRHARATWWTLAGLRVYNPPMPGRVRTVVFVCKGNICRSPFAARLAARHAPTSLTVVSAGLTAKQAEAPPPEAVDAARSYDVAMTGHRPQRLDSLTVDAETLVVVMEAGQWHRVRQDHPEWRNRVFLLSLFDPDTTGHPFFRMHIEDPFGKSASAYSDCFSRVDRSVRGLLGAIEATRAPLTAATARSSSPPGS